MWKQTLELKNRSWKTDLSYVDDLCVFGTSINMHTLYRNTEICKIKERDTVLLIKYFIT